MTEAAHRAEELTIVRSITQDVCLTVCLVGIAWAIAWAVVRMGGREERR